MKSKLNVLTIALFFVLSTNGFCAYISRPGLVDYNFAGAVICEKAQLKITFDHENFNAGNVFTVEIALNGSFSGSNIISMIGSLSQASSQQNVFLTVNFPSNIPAGSNFRLRVRGSNPVTFSSQLNEHPFSVAKFPDSDPSQFPENYWRGYFYTWTPTIATPIPDGNSEDIFNPLRYSGYISESDQSFEFNWGNNTAAPASIPDTNKVCGSYKDLYAIRMRRRFQLQAGYYLFSGGADDGFRFSIDGGQTWLLNDWSDHQFREVNNAATNSCGQYLQAGSYDFVVEYYENKIDARFKFSMTRTSVSADFVGLQPSYCSGASAVTLLAAGQGFFSGPGISGNLFSPQQAGTGTHTISHYLLGQCSDTVRKTVEIKTLQIAGFTGLPDTVLSNAAGVNLIPFLAGGNFSGSGVQGSTFFPDQVPAGESYSITHKITSGGCSDSLTKRTFVMPFRQLIPNLITLNRDGINEEWFTIGIPATADVQIYNRWGLLVHSGKASEKWKPLDELVPGYYFYAIQGPLKEEKWTGWIFVSESRN